MGERDWFHDLPNEIKMYIAKYLDDDDLERLKKTCKDWKIVAEEVIKARMLSLMKEQYPNYEYELAYILERLPELQAKVDKMINVSLTFKKRKAPDRRCIIL